jgi:murein DD-endopeptidase MepM/ murein hydrolase activator NlpD
MIRSLIITLFSAMFLINQIQAQDLLLANADLSIQGDLDTAPSNDKYVKWWEFDRELIPCADLYNFSWDSLNVNLPKLDARDSAEGIELCLKSDDCGYHHPCGGPINSDYGWRRYRMHKGVDIDLETGDEVYAAFDGVVRISKYNYGGFGHYVLIRHYNGIETLYGHLSKRMVEPNQTVLAGEVIGLGGSTGRSTGPHLHFETRYKGLPINPNKIISFDSQSLKMDSLSLQVSDFKVVSPPVKYYRVRSGDSLWRISRRYGTSIDRICRLNGLRRSSTLRIGRRLRVR